MKISIFPAILTLIVSMALGYLAYHVANVDADPNDKLVGIGTMLSSLLTLGCVMGLRLANGRMNVNLKVWSVVAFIILGVTNFCYAAFGVSMPYYVIVLVLLLVLHLGIAWKLANIDV